MEIKIRNADPVIVKKIDGLAKKHHMSRLRCAVLAVKTHPPASRE